jgi:hypothetical protein
MCKYENDHLHIIVPSMGGGGETWLNIMRSLIALVKDQDDVAGPREGAIAFAMELMEAMLPSEQQIKKILH